MISLSMTMAVNDTLNYCRSTVYTEERSPLHDEITTSVWKWVKERVDVVSQGAPILDVGCGSGPFLEILEREALESIGITTSEEEFEACENKGLTVLLGDMHHLVSHLENFASGIWLRHCAEHSAMPLVLLRSCCSALKESGWLYLEVPAPGTSSKHEENPNHFSVLTKESWVQLLIRSGFDIIDTASITFETVLGPDEYFCFLAKKSQNTA